MGTLTRHSWINYMNNRNTLEKTCNITKSNLYSHLHVKLVIVCGYEQNSSWCVGGVAHTRFRDGRTYGEVQILMPTHNCVGPWEPNGYELCMLSCNNTIIWTCIVYFKNSAVRVINSEVSSQCSHALPVHHSWTLTLLTLNGFPNMCTLVGVFSSCRSGGDSLCSFFKYSW